MAADVGGLVADIGLDVAALRGDIKQANRELKKGTNRMNRHLGSLRKRVDGVTRGFKGLAGASSVAIFARHTKATIDSADKMLKLTQRLGGTTEALSELEFVADRSGIAFNTLTMGLQRMVRRVAEAAEGTGEAKGALRELNLEAKSLRSLTIDQQFERIADALFGVKSESDRVRLAMKLFDSEGVSLLQTMTNGAQGIRDLRIEAQNLGVTLSQDMAEKAARAKDAMTDLSAEWSAFTRDLVLDSADGISTAIQGLRDLKDAARGLGEVSAGALGFGAQADLLDKRIVSLTDQRDRLTRQITDAQRPFVAASQGIKAVEAAVSNYRDELKLVNDELTKVKRQQLDVSTGGGGKPKTNVPSGIIPESDPGRTVEFIENLEKLQARFVTAKERADKLRESLERFKDELAPGTIGLILAEIDNIVNSGLDEIKVTSKKRLPELLDGPSNDLAERFGKSVGLSLQSEFSNAFMGIETSFGDMLRRMAADFAASNLLRGLASLIPGPFGKFLAAGIPGFATGGSFKVGGNGGTDSQLVAFKASPDETVSVTRPGQSIGGAVSAPSVIHQEFNFPFAFPEQLEAFVRNVAGPAGRNAAMQVLNAQRGRF